MKPEKIKALLKLGEGTQVEFKSSLKGPDAIGRIVSSFLNSSGGYIVCGITDDEKVTGLDVPDEQLTTFERKLHEQLSPSSLVSIQRQELDGRAIVIIEVPQGSDAPYSYKNVIYLRDGERTQVASSEAIREMVLASNIEPIRWERRHSLADLDSELDVNEIRATVEDAQKVGRAYFKDTTDVVRTLGDLSVARYGRLTNGGDVLYTKDPAMRLPQIRLRAICYNSDKAGDKFADMKSFEGPAMAMFEQAYAFIVRNTPTVSKFDKGNPKRQDFPQYPEMAVREALINAFAHRDYSSSSGGMAIHIFPRRLEIWNADAFPAGVTSEILVAGQISVLRNPDIAHVLYLRGLMEKAGRGSVLIVQECEKSGLPTPQWRSDDRLGVTLTFFTPEVTPEVTRMLAVLEGEMNRSEIMEALGLKDEKHFREHYQQTAVAAGLIEMTIPEKPKSSKQRYRLTPLGKAIRSKAKS